MFPIVCIHDFKEVMRNFRIHMEAFFFVSYEVGLQENIAETIFENLPIDYF